MPSGRPSTLFLPSWQFGSIIEALADPRYAQLVMDVLYLRTFRSRPLSASPNEEADAIHGWAERHRDVPPFEELYGGMRPFGRAYVAHALGKHMDSGTVVVKGVDSRDCTLELGVSAPVTPIIELWMVASAAPRAERDERLYGQHWRDVVRELLDRPTSSA